MTNSKQRHKQLLLNVGHVFMRLTTDYRLRRLFRLTLIAATLAAFIVGKSMWLISIGMSLSALLVDAAPDADDPHGSDDVCICEANCFFSIVSVYAHHSTMQIHIDPAAGFLVVLPAVPNACLNCVDIRLCSGDFTIASFLGAEMELVSFTFIEFE